MRGAVLQRDVAALVITGGVARALWAVNAANLALTIPLLVDYLLVTEQLRALVVPLVIVIAMFGLALAAAMRPTPLIVVSFLLVGAVGAVLYELSLLAADPTVVQHAYVLVNRPAVSLVLVGVAATTWITGIAWTVAGFAVSVAVSVTVAVATATPVRTGWGPLLMATMAIAAYLALAGIQRSQRRRIPNFDELERETTWLEGEESMRARVMAAVHDTLLNDLALVMSAGDRLDDRMVERLRADVTTLTSPEWLNESAQAVTDTEDGELRNRIMVMLSDLQWRGLTVRVTGSGVSVYRYGAVAATALIEAIGACLENVLRHSGATVAEVDLAYDDAGITAMVSDQGVGFRLDEVADDRLGIRVSVLDRIEAIGGTVRVWSSPGEGTSVVIMVPFMTAPHGAA